MKERLQILMSHYGYTAARLADEIGVQRSGISHILSGRNQPSYDFILKITNTFTEINTEWLLTGRGDMQKASMPETGTARMQDAVNSNKTFNADLFASSRDNVAKPDTSKTEIKVTIVTSIDRIVVFYKDGTFSHYLPAGKD